MCLYYILVSYSLLYNSTYSERNLQTYVVFIFSLLPQSSLSNLRERPQTTEQPHDE